MPDAKGIALALTLLTTPCFAGHRTAVVIDQGKPVAQDFGQDECWTLRKCNVANWQLREEEGDSWNEPPHRVVFAKVFNAFPCETGRIEVEVYGRNRRQAWRAARQVGRRIVLWND